MNGFANQQLILTDIRSLSERMCVTSVGRLPRVLGQALPKFGAIETQIIGDLYKRGLLVQTW
jgi:hypothetical protein